MNERQHLPDANRLSILASTILLAYAISPYVNIPPRSFGVTLFGAVYSLNFDFGLLLSLLVSMLAAVGADWLIRDHPELRETNTMQHWILPALTAWVLGVPLRNLQPGLEWWVVFAFGGILLILVFVAEYIVVDLADDLHAPAAIGLTAVSFALYLFLAISLRAAGLRLYTMLPTIVLSMALVALRTLYLRLNGRWCLVWGVAIAVIVGQFAVGFHYWPLSPLSFGLLLVGPSYALTSTAVLIEEKRPWQTLWIEPVVMLAIFWGMAVMV
ncbi:hypothetical protein ADN00_01055 [Ornatilinea apprima]|uniref:Uncharacterized protein n=1 Tax=Ornatilinea apprima TaxID=1134406 RepID=A0A0P6XKQ4_9CHLR|nr:hypothetical protein [Ornatilinea apprima]KPL80812.1 hypothetical protein ADN00_01055 [Ornatilinea apprima]